MSALAGEREARALAPPDEQIRALQTLLDDYPVRSVYGSEIYENARKALASLAAPPAVLVEPAGWALVPIEPTPEMYAADGTVVQRRSDDFGTMHLRRAIWQAMLAAAPSGVTK